MNAEVGLYKASQRLVKHPVLTNDKVQSRHYSENEDRPRLVNNGTWELY